MNKILRNPKIMVPVALLLLAGLTAWYVVTGSLVPLILLGLVLCVLVWFGSAMLVAHLRRRKQGAFDAGVAASEGIADRKREWKSWTEELEKQGIDRYELPFYLLVGEPQSGKSVLLQNSDLTFPFGQSRLSGIGGTRGCDWWFTEEAVVLDLAGRLFTHEGGASDELEWEAFLDLIGSYRPMAPANGVMLVIPCDGLLTDGQEAVARKANQIQAALVTLTNKLQAQVPIYVILTKADRIFGFAETVHRLPAEKRSGMFGWSRAAEHFDEPFDIVEVREAFGGMVSQARTLRDTMLSSLRLPEGIAEADRMYAFPDELEGLFPNLEYYLKRIFSESSLVDRLFFRGIYLTSGLQTGAPIAKVCADVLGSVGDADKRDLDGLFSKQQAYFIKDLIRRRVFSETGLVRPTAGRVKKAKRNAWLGYGLASLLAVVSVVTSVSYIVGNYSDETLDEFQQAISSSQAVAEQPGADLDTVLASMAKVRSAAEEQEVFTEATGIGRQKSFRELYVTLFDTRLTPSVRAAASQALAQTAQAEVREVSTQLLQASQAQALLSELQLTQSALEPIPPADGATGDAQDSPTTVALGLLSPEQRQAVLECLPARAEFDDQAPPLSSPARDSNGQPAPGPLSEALAAIQSRWDGLLELGGPAQLEGSARYLVAWSSLAAAIEQLDALPLNASAGPPLAELQSATASYRQASSVLLERDLLSQVAQTAGKHVLFEAGALGQLEPLEQARGALVQQATGSDSPWPKAIALRSFAKNQVFVVQEGAPGSKQVEVPTSGLETWLAAELRAACAAIDAGLFEGKPAAGVLQTLRTRSAGAFPEGDARAQRVLRAQTKRLEAGYLASYPDWKSLAGNLGVGDSIQVALAPLLEHLVSLRELVQTIDGPTDGAVLGAWKGRLTQLLKATLAEGKQGVAAWTPADFAAGKPVLSQPLLDALALVPSASGAPGALDEEALAIREAHTLGVAEALLQSWQQPGTNALVALEHLQEMLVQTKSKRPSKSAWDAWLVKADKAVAASFGNQEEFLLGLLQRDVPKGSSLAGKSKLLLQKLDPSVLLDLRQDLSGRKFKDPWETTGSVRELLPELGEAQKDLEARLAGRHPDWLRLRSTVSALRRYASMTRPVEFNEADLSGPLEGYASDLSADKIEGPALAKASREWLVATAQLQERDPQPSLYDTYMEVLAQDLQRAANDQQEELYREGLASLLDKTSYKPVLAALFLSDPSQLPTDALQVRQLHEGLDSLIGDGDKFGAFRKSHSWRPRTQPMGLDLGFGDRESEDPDVRDDWDLDRFLWELRAYFGQSDGKSQDIDKWKVELKVDPVTPTAGIKNLWNNFNRYAYFYSSLIDRERLENVPLTPRSEDIPSIEWTPAMGSEPMFFEWSLHATNETVPSNPRLELGSFLAPLVWAWSGDPEGDETLASERWDVVFRHAAQPLDQAPFRLKFGRPLPLRPKR